MQKQVITFFAFCLFEVITISAARYTDPLTVALEQILADVTFEIVPYPTYPSVYYDGFCQCGNPSCSACTNYCYDATTCQCGSPTCTARSYDIPTCQSPSCACGQCPLPACNCYRDIKNPCNVFEDSCPLYYCFESCDYQSPPIIPCIYFPEVEYPMTAMDVKPYYYGSCWCS